MEGYIGEVRLFGGNFAPRAWAFCEGQLLSISANTALFSIIGCTYGGDCRTTFALPDLRGRTAIGAGDGPGLTDRRLGAKTGSTTVTLTTTQIPSHNHVLNANTAEGTLNSPQNAFSASGQTAGNPPNIVPVNPMYSPTANTTMNGNANGLTGGGQSHNNMQPSLALYYIICLQGIFPSRG